ncbi:putative metalloprotease CJM1_0395 family protein [Zoogloea sp.]|uniref:putative metalloprotease CJM1_0395 family protein n=1 Tax=Zoogloea sp. TaxID=49181 RepID=UPI0035B12072
MSDAEQQLVSRLAARDRLVRAHEAAHLAAGAGLITRGASFTYETGPDGKRYAVGGEVGIDVSKGRTPEDTLARAERIRAAALAPADPSAQDRQVASEAARMAAEARLEIAAAAPAAASGTRGAGAYAGAAGVPGGQVDVWA